MMTRWRRHEAIVTVARHQRHDGAALHHRESGHDTVACAFAVCSVCAALAAVCTGPFNSLLCTEHEHAHARAPPRAKPGTARGGGGDVALPIRAPHLPPAKTPRCLFYAAMRALLGTSNPGDADMDGKDEGDNAVDAHVKV